MSTCFASLVALHWHSVPRQGTRPAVAQAIDEIGRRAPSVVGLMVAAALWCPPAAAVPNTVGACSETEIQEIGTRLQGMPASGSAVRFTDGGHQVSYQSLRAIERSRPGDNVRVCLVSIPRNCPPGDERGRVYRTTNLRTHDHWTLPDSEHSCGGA